MRHLLAQVSPEQTLRDRLKALVLGILHKKRLDDAVTGECFIHDVRHLAQFLLVGTAQGA